MAGPITTQAMRIFTAGHLLIVLIVAPRCVTDPRIKQQIEEIHRNGMLQRVAISFTCYQAVHSTTEPSTQTRLRLDKIYPWKYIMFYYRPKNQVVCSSQTESLMPLQGTRGPGFGRIKSSAVLTECASFAEAQAARHAVAMQMYCLGGVVRHTTRFGRCSELALVLLVPTWAGRGRLGTVGSFQRSQQLCMQTQIS